VLGAALIYQQRTNGLTKDHSALLSSLVGLTVARWQEPDNGIWEVRCERRHFTHSKVMAWICIDRGIQLADSLGVRDAPLARWRAAREEIRSEVLRRGYDREVGASSSHTAVGRSTRPRCASR
jgi:alpha,alpha-trehalase